jgi:hypothetical protein
VDQKSNILFDDDGVPMFKQAKIVLKDDRDFDPQVEYGSDLPPPMLDGGSDEDWEEFVFHDTDSEGGGHPRVRWSDYEGHNCGSDGTK